MRTAIILALVLAAIVVATLAVLRQQAPNRALDDEPPTMTDPAASLPDICEDIVFEGSRAVVCPVDPSQMHLRLFHTGADGKPFGSVPALAAAMGERNPQLVLAMNAGMYHADMRPVGLHVEDGKEMSPLERADGVGNFYLKPNGVFFVDENGKAGVMETEAFAAAAPAVRLATQSGPMLLIGGAIHPKFLPEGTSRYIRNGVGVRDDGTVVFVITRDQVSLGRFARLFRDAAHCVEALFFDGAVSSLATGEGAVIDSGKPAGPIIAVFAGDSPPA